MSLVVKIEKKEEFLAKRTNSRLIINLFPEILTSGVQLKEYYGIYYPTKVNGVHYIDCFLTREEIEQYTEIVSY